jgi:hypothetical protein
VDESWIGDRVQLIRRMKSWVNASYPGTAIGITEYNWGAENHINGATAQADIYGIFGREGLDMGARWATPAAYTPTYKAMKMYRNYDGNRSTFGDTSVSATVPNPDTLAAFAAERSSDGALTVMVVSKQLTSTTPVTLNIANFAHHGDGAGVAAHRRQRDHAAGGCFNQQQQQQQQQQPDHHSSRSERDVVRSTRQRHGRATASTDEPADHSLTSMKPRRPMSAE